MIHSNKKHPFLTVEKGFLPIGQIKLGMHVHRADGRVGTVTGWKQTPGILTMYNLEVAQDHTFTVGDGQWVVHNSDCGKIYSANGDPALRATRRPAFDQMMSDGVDINGENYTLHPHAKNSLFKSGRKDIMPDDIIDAIATNDPRPANPGSVEYVNPHTGTSVFVNPDTNQIVGVWPSSFGR